MTEIFLIEKIFFNNIGTDLDSAVGYEPHGWVETEEEAKGIVDKGKIYTIKDYWAIPVRSPMKEFTYRKLVKKI